MTFTFVLGGARSGKSRYAQQAAEATSTTGPLTMIVTAEAHDDEMHARIAQHRAQRGPRWKTVEAPLDLAAVIRDLGPVEVTVVDCLTLWASNLLMHERNIETQAAQLLSALKTQTAPLWVISNEVGLGIVPENALARRFRDDIGRLHQRIAEIADSVVMVVAGLPLRIK